MRFAKASFALAVVLFTGGATAVLGSWAVSTSCLLLLVGAIVGAIAMEERDLSGVEGLVSAPEGLAEVVELPAAPEPTALDAA